MMKKLILTLALALPFGAAAQLAKVAVVNIQEIYNAMPEKAKAEAQLKTASEQYQKEYKLLQDDFGKKYAAYQQLAADAKVLPTIKERRMQEIQASDNQVQAFLKKADADLEKMRSDLNAPIMEKISHAVKTVGDAGGFTYIFDISKTPIVYSGATAIDLTSQVKFQLGL